MSSPPPQSSAAFFFFFFFFNCAEVPPRGRASIEWEEGGG
jgi:hypothetical protein